MRKILFSWRGYNVYSYPAMHYEAWNAVEPACCSNKMSN